MSESMLLPTFQVEQCNGAGLPRVPRDPTQMSRARAVITLVRAVTGGQKINSGSRCPCDFSLSSFTASEVHDRLIFYSVLLSELPPPLSP